ncbi:MAG: hypothetical protein IJS63_06950 [Bacteroidaceae bacterium]|nr:hypothetical protein [Bacteroidaceae bacterium]
MYVSKLYQAAVDSYGDVRTLVHGLPYQCPNDWEDVLDSLDEDSNLYLIKEPDNPKDELAIAAYLDDRRIGYVAASDNGKIWLYMTDDKMPCQFVERFEASFKIAFENPRSIFEDIPFEEIYRDKFGLSEQHFPKFEIPFLNNPKDNRYIWFDDKTRIVDMEKGIPDFRRKLAARMIIIVGRKNSVGEYCYYIPYLDRPISDIYDSIIQGLIDKYGFVIALPDVPRLTHQGLILMDLHVTYLSKTNYKDFELANQYELVFSLTKDYDVSSQMAADNQTIVNSDKKHNCSRDLAIDNEDLFMQEPQSTPSYSKSDYILKKGEETTSSIDKSIFAIIDKVTTELFSFVRQTLFPSMELFSYLKKHTPYYDQFYDFGQFETMIRVFVIKDLGRIYKGLNHSFNFDTAAGKPLYLYMAKEAGESTDISYDVFAQICDSKTQLEPVVNMRKIIEDLTKSFYEYDIALWTDSDFMIHSFLKDVDNELAKRYMELMRQFASAATTSEMCQVNSEEEENVPEKVNYDEKDKIQEAVFQHCIFDVLGVVLKDTPNSKWEYESWNVFGGGYETYIFSAPGGNTGKYQKCEAIVNRNRNNNYKFIGLNADTVLSLLYHYRRIFDSSYQFEQCKEEYYKNLDDPIESISIETTPWLYIRRSDGYSIGDSKTAQYDVILYTSLYNKEYIDTLISQGELITIFK